MIAFVPTFLAEAAAPQGVAVLGIDPWAILAQAVTFLILLWVIKKFALTKIIATLEARRQTIDKGVLLGIEMEKEKSLLDEKVEELLRQARVEADKIIAGGKTEANEMIKAAEEAAQRQAEGILAEARGHINDDIAKAKHELKKDMVALVAQATEVIIDEKKDMVALVAQATEVIIDEKIDAGKDAKLIERALAVSGKESR